MKSRGKFVAPFLAMALGAVLIVSACGGAAPAPTAAPAKPAATAAPAAPAAPAATKPAAAATTAPTAAAAPQKIDYPTRPVELVVPFGAGGAADVAARRIAAIVEKDLGQPMTVINVTGAGGAVAYQRIKNARPDGYSLLWSSAAMATLPAQGNIDFDYKALDHIAMVATETVSLTVASKSQWKMMKEFIDEGKKRSNPYNVGNSGVGSFTHLSSEAISQKIGVPFQHIAFGTGLAVTNLLGGHIDASVQHPAEVLPALKSGDIRMLVVTSNDRIPAFKDVPTMKELGYDLLLEQFRSVSAPKGTPAPVLQKLEAAFLKAADAPEWATQQADVGAQVRKMGSTELTQFMAQQHELIAQLSKSIKTEQKK